MKAYSGKALVAVLWALSLTPSVWAQSPTPFDSGDIVIDDDGASLPTATPTHTGTPTEGIATSTPTRTGTRTGTATPLVSATVTRTVKGLAACGETHNAVPRQNDQFMPDLQTFLCQEDADRYAEQFEGIVASGGDQTALGNVLSISQLSSYPNGFLALEAASITFAASNIDCWVIATPRTDSPISGWDRVDGTNYMTQCSGSKPASPRGTIWLSRVTLDSGGNIVATLDLRNRMPHARTVENLEGIGDEFVDAPRRGQLVYDLYTAAYWYFNGGSWQRLSGIQVLTTAGPWDPPSINQAATEGFSVPMDELTSDYVCVASHTSLGASGLQITAHVQATGLVAVDIANLTGSTVDLPNGTVTIKCIR